MRYVLHPGTVESQKDGQWHHIGARELALLYKVPMSQCIVHNQQGPDSYREMEGDVHLYPSYTAQYHIPKPELTIGDLYDALAKIHSVRSEAIGCAIRQSVPDSVLKKLHQELKDLRSQPLKEFFK